MVISEYNAQPQSTVSVTVTVFMYRCTLYKYRWGRLIKASTKYYPVPRVKMTFEARYVLCTLVLVRARCIACVLLYGITGTQRPPVSTCYGLVFPSKGPS